MKKIFSISLALLLLVVHVGPTLATHFCGGHAVKTALMLGEGHLDCGMGMPEMDVDKDYIANGVFFQNKACCENQYLTLEIEDYSPHQLNLHTDIFIAFVQTFIYRSFLHKAKDLPYADYSPPLLLRDIPVLNQTFLI